MAAARRCGFSSVSANDHLVYGAPWLDGIAALASVAGAGMDLLTSVALPVLRGPAALATSLAAVDVLSGGRLVAGVGPGSSRADYEAAGIPFEERWRRFDESLPVLRSLLDIPVWVGSWGSPAGLRRVARYGDGWVASAYNTDPARFRDCLDALAELGRPDLPHALVTMWTLVTDRPDEALAMLAGLTGRDAEELRPRVCVGSAEQCADLLSRFAAAGCRRVHFWFLGDEVVQIERFAAEVLPRVSGSGTAP